MGDYEAPKNDRRTVFVQGISFEMQDTQFEEAFSEIGPIRKCFLLRRRGEKRHKVKLCVELLDA
jgi:nucleolar protein 4